MQWLKFSFIGVLNTLFTLVIFEVLLFFTHYTAAYTLSFALGICFSYFFNTLYTFQQNPNRSSALLYALFYSSSYLLGLFSMLFCVEVLTIPKSLTPIFVTVILFPMNYRISRRIIRYGRSKKANV